jgi:hypothetical protein
VAERHAGLDWVGERHGELQDHTAVVISDASRPRLDLTATRPIAGAAVTHRAARGAERAAPDDNPTSATTTEG